MRNIGILPLAILAGALTLTAQNCTTPDGATVPDGQASAAANFTVGNGFITVTISNTLADPRSAGQLLSGVAFTLSSGQTSAVLGPNSANLRRIARGGSFTDFGPSATGWALDDNFNGGFRLCVLCTDLGAVGPSHLLIGDPAANNLYASANGSIAGNRPHNPFTAGPATFLINAPGVSQYATVTGATFFFSTQEGVAVPGSCGDVGQPE
ncbi:MAG: hypothetical protein ACRD9L_11710 [Bryobacteraceae bacterium]